MKNKSTEIRNLLESLSREELPEFSIVDYWDADTTAIGFQKGDILIYVSTFSKDKTKPYSIIVEDLKTGKELWFKEKKHIRNLLMSFGQF
ncbi:hypothetical protein [Chryseobacterium lactis]|uniref:hypothetical protein n=1 Tax=Chryseobacterium lactis TaxID=1241981 RepID=UPI001629CCB9|nr:hypothetical protein [Chryseobacterium lactis]